MVRRPGLHEPAPGGHAIRKLVTTRLSNASVSLVEIERGINHVTVTVHTAKPGIVIGKGGANVEALRQQVGKLTTRKVKLEIKEIRQPELDAVLVAANIAQQLSRRIAFRKAIKQAIQRTMKAGAKGVKISVAGRLGGSEMARREWDREGRIPLGTLRADISYGQVLSRTTYGAIGVKVWIYRGDVLPERTAPREAAAAAAEARNHVDAQARQAPQGHARPHVRRRQGRLRDRLRRLRPDDRGAGLDHQPPDRGRAARHDPLRQARRQDLDPHLPGQAGDQEAGRSPHGLRQGRTRPLGRGGQARPHPVRDVRRARGEADEAMRLAGHKLPVDVRFLAREGVVDGHH